MNGTLLSSLKTWLPRCVIENSPDTQLPDARVTHLQVINKIGPHRFAAICSDNTGNTKKARRIVVEKFPAILNLADVCHHLANTAKDISKLLEFQKVWLCQ
jgi:hypothetical protein